MPVLVKPDPAFAQVVLAALHEFGLTSVRLTTGNPEDPDRLMQTTTYRGG